MNAVQKNRQHRIKRLETALLSVQPSIQAYSRCIEAIEEALNTGIPLAVAAQLKGADFDGFEFSDALAWRFGARLLRANISFAGLRAHGALVSGLWASSVSSFVAADLREAKFYSSDDTGVIAPGIRLDSGQNHEQIMGLLRGNLHQIPSAADQSVQRMLKSAVPGEQNAAYWESSTVPKNTETSIGLKLLAWTARSLLDPDTAYKQHLEQQRRFQWPFPHSSRAFLLRATRNFHIPNLREDDFLLIEPDAPVLTGRDVVVVRSDDAILLGRVMDTPSGQFLFFAINAGEEELLPLDASMRVVGVIASRLQRF